MLREALAVGADERAPPVGRRRGRRRKPAVTSMLLGAALRTEGLPDLVLCGWRSLARGSGEDPGAAGRVPQLAGGHRHHRAGDPGGTGLFPAPSRPRRTFGRRGDHAGGARDRRRERAPALRQPARLDAGQAGDASRFAIFPTSVCRRWTCVSRPRRCTRRRRRGRGRAPSSSPTASCRRTSASARSCPPASAQKAGRMVEGPPEEMADVIIAFLRERGFLDQPA